MAKSVWILDKSSFSGREIAHKSDAFRNFEERTQDAAAGQNCLFALILDVKLVPRIKNGETEERTTETIGVVEGQVRGCRMADREIARATREAVLSLSLFASFISSADP